MLKVDANLQNAERISLGCGEAVMFAAPAADKPQNEDSLAVIDVSTDACVLAVADGVGGGPQGSDASRIAVEALESHLASTDDDSLLRARILDAFEHANSEIASLRAGAATTLCVAEITRGYVRTYHTGDSGILLTGRGGKLKLRTVFHSPSGYAEESGLMSEAQALLHDDRHYLSNWLGSEQMSVEVSVPVKMAPFDTLVLASDGLFDNCTSEEVIEVIRRGDLFDSGEALRAAAADRMVRAGVQVPAKVDDIAFILFRRHRTP